jgi:hypothetical protein
VVTNARGFFYTRGRGCNGHPAFPAPPLGVALRPLIEEGGTFLAKLGRIARRDREGNHFGAQTFRRDDLIQGLLKLAASRGWPKASETTVRRDVECFLRTYASPAASFVGAPEDALESPLAELGRVRTVGRRDDYQFARGAKPTLPAGVFAQALHSFWERVGATRTLSFEMIAHEPGSPGRVFLLDEAALADRLVKLEDQTEGLFRWSETAGLRQVVRGGEVDGRAISSLIKASYKKSNNGEMRS